MAAATRRIAVLAAAVLLALAACLASFRAADAATLDRSGFDGVPADTVQLDRALFGRDAEFSTDGAFSYVRKSDSSAKAVKYDGYLGPYTAAQGSATLKWQNAGVDADGDEIDLVVTIRNVRTGPDGMSDFHMFRQWSSGCEFCSSTDPTYGSNGGGMSLSLEATTKVVKHGTSTPAAGNMLISFTDIDVVRSSPYYSEQIELVSGYGSKVWVPPTNFLSISQGATRFTATRADSGTYDSGFVFIGSTGGFTLKWQGQACGTGFLLPFKVNEQSVTASAGAGGKISDPGKTYLRWKNDKTYTVTPDAHYRVKDVKVDGKSVGAVTSYTFKGVTGHHTIQATFEPLPKYTVKFVDGFGTTLSAQTVEEGAAAKAPADPAHDGWAFIGWDRDFSKVTSNLTVTAKWDPVIAVRIPTLVACQIQRDGSVVAPTGYAIENLSPVPVELESAVTTGMPSFGSYELSDESGDVVHSYSGGADHDGAALEIGIGGSAPLAWSVGDIVGEAAQDLLYEALRGQAPLCDVHFVFEEA